MIRVNRDDISNGDIDSELKSFTMIFASLKMANSAVPKILIC